MYCKKCGKQIDDDSMFCSYCGTKVNNETKIQKEVIPEKMITFSETLIDDYKIVLPIKTMYVGISESLEKYNLVYKKFKQLSNVCSGHFLNYYSNKIKNIDDVISKLPDFFEEELTEVISGAIAVLVNMGVNEYNRDNFIDEYYEYFDYSQYFDEAIKAHDKVYQFNQLVDQYRNAQRGARSTWTGGGFGISGAIKGAVTAGLMNSGMGILRSIKDSHVDAKDNERLAKLKREVLTAYPIKDRLNQGIKDCCYGVFEAIIDILESNSIIKPIEIDETKANAIFENTVAYEKDAENYNKQMIKCIELNPYDGRFYAALASSYGDENNEIEHLADIFGCSSFVYQIKSETIKKLKRNKHDEAEIYRVAKFLGLYEEAGEQEDQSKQNEPDIKPAAVLPLPSDLKDLYSLMDKSVEEQIEYVRQKVNKQDIDISFKSMQFKKLWDLASGGHIYAIYTYEKYLEKNVDRGFIKEFERLAKEGFKTAEFLIYQCMYTNKKYSSYQKDAEQDMVRMAEKNEVMYTWAHAGYILYHGKYTTPDYPKAYQYLSKAAEALHPVALFWLGQMYKLGSYIAPDERFAKLCTVCSAGLGYQLALDELKAEYNLQIVEYN